MGKSNEALKKCMSDRHEFDHNGILFELQMIPYPVYLGKVFNAISNSDEGGMWCELLYLSLVKLTVDSKVASTKVVVINGDRRDVVTPEEIEALPTEAMQKLFKETKQFYEGRGKSEKN